jgi:hypothetical protein
MSKSIPKNNKILMSITNILNYIHQHVLYLNNSKFFAGIIIILMNIGSRFVVIKLSKSTEEYVKNYVSRQLLIFTIAWMGTRDIYLSLGLTAVFVVLADYLINNDSNLCIIPKKYRILKNVIDTDGDGEVTDDELQKAIDILEKDKINKQKKNQIDAFTKFDNLLYNNY